MSKAAKIKRALTLFSLGATTLSLCLPIPSLPSVSLPGFEFGGIGCCGLNNTNLSGFYQDVCTASVEAVADATANNVFGENSDFDEVVIEPIAAFWTSTLCDNCIPQDFPLDVGDANWLQ
jgi:hypothetical protein